MPPKFRYGIDDLTFEKACGLAAGRLEGIIDDQASEAIRRSQEIVEKISIGDEPVYGINTGFGPLCTQKIAPEDTTALQHNLLKSHSAGVGDPIPDEIVRLMFVTKIHALSRGYSGIRRETIDRMLYFLKNDILPVIPAQGSVGASGDLAPLAHLSLPLIGLGYARMGEKVTNVAKIHEEKGIEPLTLHPKEALALINGTQFIVAWAVHFLERFKRLLDLADFTGAMSLEGLMGSHKPFIPELAALRPFTGSKLVAERMLRILKGSEIQRSHEHCDRVQDPYSLRCIPAVHGASRNAWEHLRDMVETELNSVTDNPIILPDGQSVSGGNFHGQLLAIPLDYAAVAASEIGNISERRSYLMLEGKYGLPKMLIANSGLHSGFMIPQYTAAALVSENKSLCFPASADSIPTSMGQEDHVSMGSISGRKAVTILANTEYILSIELMYALQALEFRKPLRSSPLITSVHDHLRGHISFVEEDRMFSDDIKLIHDMLVSGELTALITGNSKQLGIDIN